MSNAPNKQTLSTRARSKARRLAMQAIYQWQMTDMEADEIDAQFRVEKDTAGADLEYFTELLSEVTARVETLDEMIAPRLDRPVLEVDPVERAVLRMAAYELAHRLDVPYKVVINEAVALAKKFGAEDSHAYVNGVMDKVSRVLRAVEHPCGGSDSDAG